MLENQKVILYKTASTAEFPDDFQTRFHTHIYCQSGTVEFSFNGRQYHCKKGEFFFCLVGEVCFPAPPKEFLKFVLQLP